MSGGPRVRSMNFSDSDQRPVLVPAGNKPARQRKVHKSPEKQSKTPPTSPPVNKNLTTAPSILRNLGNRLTRSQNASCSSDASSDSSNSRASSGKMISRSSVPVRRKQGGLTRLDRTDDVKIERVEKVAGDDGLGLGLGLVAELDGLALRKRCAWVSPNADPSYANFHDEEWGVPVHDDNKLFELLSLSVALAELSWLAILNKRNLFREVFLDFDPISVSKLNDKKFSVSGNSGNTLLSELKLRNIVENARQVCKIKDEFGSFHKYIWGFMNHKPLVNKFRYPRQVPVKTSKAEAISKDLVKRGFRGVGPTVVYSFMQVAGLTNDHLVTCFRFQECVGVGEKGVEKDNNVKSRVEEKKLEIGKGLDEVSICSD